jgi:hypothetical protein
VRRGTAGQLEGEGIRRRGMGRIQKRSEEESTYLSGAVLRWTGVHVDRGGGDTYAAG